MADTPSDIDHVTGRTTTGHEWDGIRELNTPLPRWWLWLFYITIIWSVGYWIVYPSWPLLTTYSKGVFGWQSREAIKADLADLATLRGATMTQIAAAKLENIESDPKLLAFARAVAKPAFGTNCAPCHGSGAAGFKGYPNLNDDDWLWGGTLADVEATIRHGIRLSDTASRQGSMPAFGRDGILPRPDIEAVTDHVRQLAGLAPAQPTAAKGAKVYAESCAACHGEKGEGKRELGAPNLTDKIWLYGSSRENIVEGLVNGRGGVMPGWAGRLDEATIKALSVYVHTLGGGEN